MPDALRVRPATFWKMGPERHSSHCKHAAIRAGPSCHICGWHAGLPLIVLAQCPFFFLELAVAEPEPDAPHAATAPDDEAADSGGALSRSSAPSASSSGWHGLNPVPTGTLLGVPRAQCIMHVDLQPPELCVLPVFTVFQYQIQEHSGVNPSSRRHV